MGLFDRIAEAERDNLPFAIVTVTGAEGTVPRREGRMAVFADGSAAGTVGGGVVEAEAKAKAMECLASGCGMPITVRNGGKGCVSLFIDVPVPDRSVIIVGRGHVGSAIGEMMRHIGWHVSMLEKGIGPEALLSERVTSSTAIVIAGAADSSLVPAALSSPAFYVGLLASRSLRLPPDPRLYFPIGLDIGERTPEEIALSVSAEILAAFNGRSGRNGRGWDSRLVAVRGAGDLATGVIVRLFRAGYSVIALESVSPTTIRRTVSLSEAVYDGEAEVEGVRGMLAHDDAQVRRILDSGAVPVIVDPDLRMLSSFRPRILVDAIIAKRNLGTRKDMAPLVIALGPGFEAGVDCDAVIETKRGHTLGSVIRSGRAEENTGVPGSIAGYASERVIHSPSSGIFRGVRHIGDIVSKGDLIACVGETEVRATIDGMLRGLLHDGLAVTPGFKIADIDPRGEAADFRTISDKARAIAGGVLEVCSSFLNRSGK